MADLVACGKNQVGRKFSSSRFAAYRIDLQPQCRLPDKARKNFPEDPELDNSTHSGGELPKANKKRIYTP